jgi:hypothetical protein
MSRSLGALAVAALAASVTLVPAATLAFNPQPDPPGKRAMKQSKSLGGPDTGGTAFPTETIKPPAGQKYQKVK